MEYAGEISTVQQLNVVCMCLYCGPAVKYLEPLVRLGLISLSADGDIRPDRAKFDALMALGVSLSQLTPLRNSSVVANPLFGRPKQPPTPAELFVVMPFDERLRAVYSVHIKAVAERLSIAAVRADDFFAANSIVSDVWNSIVHAKVIVADCTDRNANVFYELGIAHTLGKSVVLITERQEDIPFDVQHMRVVNYEMTPEGMADFEQSLERTIRHELQVDTTISGYLASMPSDGSAS